jgi:hypothetical protein
MMQFEHVVQEMPALVIPFSFAKKKDDSIFMIDFNFANFVLFEIRPDWFTKRLVYVLFEIPRHLFGGYTVLKFGDLWKYKHYQNPCT